MLTHYRGVGAERQDVIRPPRSLESSTASDPEVGSLDVYNLVVTVLTLIRFV